MDAMEIIAAQEGKYKSTEVKKEVELELDLGNLLATDLNPIDTEAFKKDRETYLKELMRDNTQLLLNGIWQLPTEKVDEVIVAQLPAPSTVLPREKKLPKPKAPTKWESFAASKGIMKRKRSRMVFDEVAQEWKPRYGYKRVNDPKDEWVIEVPEGSDPTTDFFKKKEDERKEKVAKTEFQRLKNLSTGQRGRKVKVPLPPPATKDLNKHQLSHAIGLAKSATASLGKFTPSLPAEPKVKKKSNYKPVAGNMASEREKSLEILSKLAKPKEVLDVKKSVNLHMASTEEKRKDLKRPQQKSKGGPPQAKRHRGMDGGGRSRFRKEGGRKGGGGRGGGGGRKGGGGRGGRGQAMSLGQRGGRIKK